MTRKHVSLLVPAVLILILTLSSCATTTVGSITPVGSIIAYGGDVSKIENDTKEEWLVCDGRSKNVDDFPELALAIGKFWGGDGKQFNIPDLRGLFLRGVNSSTEQGQRPDRFADPDGQTRIIGSIQEDALKKHHHTFDNGDIIVHAVNVNAGGGLGGGGVTNPKGENQTAYEGGAETRPKNADVYYLIRAK